MTQMKAKQDTVTILSSMIRHTDELLHDILLNCVEARFNDVLYLWGLLLYCRPMTSYISRSVHPQTCFPDPVLARQSVLLSDQNLKIPVFDFQIFVFRTCWSRQNFGTTWICSDMWNFGRTAMSSGLWWQVWKVWRRCSWKKDEAGFCCVCSFSPFSVDSSKSCIVNSPPTNHYITICHVCH